MTKEVYEAIRYLVTMSSDDEVLAKERAIIWAWLGEVSKEID